MGATIQYNHTAGLQKAALGVWRTKGTWLYFLRTEDCEDDLFMAELLSFYSFDTSKKCGLLLSMKRVFFFR